MSSCRMAMISAIIYAKGLHLICLICFFLYCFINIQSTMWKSMKWNLHDVLHKSFVVILHLLLLLPWTEEKGRVGSLVIIPFLLFPWAEEKGWVGCAVGILVLLIWAEEKGWAGTGVGAEAGLSMWWSCAATFTSGTGWRAGSPAVHSAANSHLVLNATLCLHMVKAKYDITISELKFRNEDSKR